MPATRAARGLEPTARNWKPRVERLISHHSSTAEPAAITSPACSRNWGPSRTGRVAESAIDGEVGWDWLATVKTVVLDRKSTRLNSSHVAISYAVFCLKKKRMKRRWRCVRTRETYSRS